MWSWYWALRRRAARGDGFSQPLGYSDIAAWATMTRTLVRPEEVEMLVAMDDAYLSTSAEEREAQRKADEADAKVKAKRGGKG